MTVLYLALSVVPIIQVESRVMFAVKISGLIGVTNVVGLGIYLAVGRRNNRESGF
jgi:hypothetical protein